MKLAEGIIIVQTDHSHFLPSLAEMQAFEKKTIAAGTTELELMQNAGEAVARLIAHDFAPDFGADHPFTVLCGPGNNGGDGFVTARKLREEGASVTVIVMAAPKYSEGLTAQISASVNNNEDFSLFSEDARQSDEATRMLDRKGLQEILDSSWLVVDALLGVGQKDAPRGAVKVAIECLNQAYKGSAGQLKIFSIDIPSGINAETGEVFEPHVTPSCTVVMELLKRGMIQSPARDICGDLVVVPLALQCAERTEFTVLLGDALQLKLSRRPISGHKGAFGRVFIVAGSEGMPGAAALAANASIRTGAGLVTATEFAPAAAPAMAPEILIESFNSPCSPACLERLSAAARAASCLVLGPGLGLAQDTAAAVRALLKLIEKEQLKAVIDADALNVLAAAIQAGERPALTSAVLTPHPGEMGRLLGISPAQVQGDRYSAAKKLHELTGAIVLLKGASSVVWDGKSGYVNLTGNPYMATAGSGDVLAGMIAAFVAQGRTALEAGLCGVFYHGRAGDLAYGEHRGPIIASDIIAQIPRALSVEQPAQ